MVDTAITTAANAVNDLAGAGVYTLVVDPFKTGSLLATGARLRYDVKGIPLLTPKEAILTAIASFDDLADSNRPIFSDTAQVSALGFLLTAPSAEALKALLDALYAILKFPWLKEIGDRVGRHVNTGTSPVSQAAPPDWRKDVNITGVEELRNARDQLRKAQEYLNGYKTTADDSVNALTSVISDKAAAATASSTALANIVNNALSLNSTTGLYTLNIPPSIGGNSLVKAELRDCPLERSQNQYTILLLMLNGGPNISGIDNFRKAVVF
jgi:hypothetical protein